MRLRFPIAKGDVLGFLVADRRIKGCKLTAAVKLTCPAVLVTEPPLAFGAAAALVVAHAMDVGVDFTTVLIIELVGYRDPLTGGFEIDCFAEIFIVYHLSFLLSANSRSGEDL